jgi:uncharacterized protein YgiM (DUF1202 family)
MMRLRARLGAFALAALLALGAAGFIGVAPAVAAFVNGDEVVVFDGALNLRQAPGLSGLIIQVLPDGTPLTVTGGPQMADAMEWYPVVTASAVAGFVVGQYIQLAAPTGDFQAGDDVYVADGPLNLRSAAGTGASILATLPTNTTAEILAGPTASGGLDWYQVAPQGFPNGWVAGDFLALSTDPGGDFSAGDDIYVADGPLNLRSAAGTGSSIVTTLPTGTTGEVLAGPTAANGFDWYQIQVTGGQQGWAAGDFLALDDNGPTPSGDFEAGSFVFVNVAKLNLRSTASVDAAVLQTMTDGTVATVVSGPTSADGYEWYRISVGGTEGYAVGQYLVGGFKLNENAVVVDGPLNLRQSASTGSPSLAALQTGATVLVTSGPTAAGGLVWFGVDSNGTDGFVAGRYLGAAS